MWLFLAILLALAAIAAYGLIVFSAAVSDDGHPDVDLIIEREHAKARASEALNRLADRQRLQQQREASARISRGW